MFYGTGIPVSLWFLNRDKTPGGSRAWRDRKGEALFVDARSLGHMVSRVHRDLSAEDITRVADTFQARRGERGAGEYADVPGFCYSATDQEIAEHRHALTPGRYVGAQDVEDDDEELSAKIARLSQQVRLASLRDALLPALMLGTVLVREAEELVENLATG